MTETQRTLFEQVGKVAVELPPAVVEQVAGLIAATRPEEWPTPVVGSIFPACRRAALSQLLSAWAAAVPRPSREELAASLLACLVQEERRRSEQSLELVWTGPDSEVIPVRHTEQVLLEIIKAARRTLTLVSFAVYKIDRIAEELVSAAGRGVRVRIILEGAEPGQSEYDPLIAFGREAVACCQVLYWPLHKRPLKPDGKPASLHVKCAIADGQRMLISSANLTDYAFRLNMELGIAVTGGCLPAQVERHFDELLVRGELNTVL